MEAQCNTLDRVLYMTTDRAKGSQFLSISPFVNQKPLLFLSKETGLYFDVTEVPPQGSSGAHDNNCVSLQSDVDIFWNVNSTDSENGVFTLTVDASEKWFTFNKENCTGLSPP